MDVIWFCVPKRWERKDLEKKIACFCFYMACFVKLEMFLDKALDWQLTILIKSLIIKINKNDFNFDGIFLHFSLTYVVSHIKQPSMRSYITNNLAIIIFFCWITSLEAFSSIILQIKWLNQKNRRTIPGNIIRTELQNLQSMGREKKIWWIQKAVPHVRIIIYI